MLTTKRLLTPLLTRIMGFALLIVAAVICSYVVTYAGPQKGIGVGVAIVGIAIAAYSMLNFVFGFYASVALGFFIFFIGRIVGESFKIGIIMDAQIWVTFGGLLLHKVLRRESFFSNASHVISYVYLIYTAFLILQVFNPNMHSIDGWFLIVRKFLQFILIYLIAINVFSSMARIEFFFRFTTVMAGLCGFYGCYQEWFGLLDFETNWIFSDPIRVGLYRLYDGNFRKFSTLSDPAAFGIIMAAFALLVLVLAVNSNRNYKKLLLLVAAVGMLMGVAYSGTRTAYFMITVGVLLYIMLTISNKRTLIFAGFFSAAFVVIVWGPIYGNTTINRIRSTFEFSEDSSLEVRDLNRKKIQPYIYSHPIGGGLATSGVQGVLYNPGHELAGFPPDSGYIRTAIETGWIGLIFQCLIYFIVLRSAVHVYYNTTIPRAKTYLLAITICLFSFIVAQYSQEAIAQVPGFFLFYSGLAIVVRLKQISLPQEKRSGIRK